MSEAWIDPEGYRGMNPQEAKRAVEEERRRAINEDPGLQKARREMEERQQAEREEERRAAEEAHAAKETASERAWEEEYLRQLRTWSASGGTEAEFEEAWPEIRRRTLMERDAENERRKREVFSGFKL